MSAKLPALSGREIVKRLRHFSFEAEIILLLFNTRGIEVFL
jgi:hypothetical protein